MARKARGLQHAPDIDNNGAARSIPLSYNDLSKCLPDRGGMCERLKQAVLKTAIPERVSGVRIPLPPPLTRADSSRQLAAKIQQSGRSLSGRRLLDAQRLHRLDTRCPSRRDETGQGRRQRQYDHRNRNAKRVVGANLIQLVGHVAAAKQRDRNPNASPKPTCTNAPRSTMRTTLFRSAPRAMRSPISLVRRATAYDVMP